MLAFFCLHVFDCVGESVHDLGDYHDIQRTNS